MKKNIYMKRCVNICERPTVRWDYKPNTPMFRRGKKVA